MNDTVFVILVVVSVISDLVVKIILINQVNALEARFEDAEFYVQPDEEE